MSPEREPTRPAPIVVGGQVVTVSTEAGAIAQPTAFHCPAGLEPLVGIKHLIIKQSFYEGENNPHLPKHFDVLTEGGRIYHTSETVNPLMRLTEIGTDLPYNVIIFHNGQPVLQLVDEVATCFSLSFCDIKTQMYYGGFVLGTIVKHSWNTYSKPSFKLFNHRNQPVLLIQSVKKKFLHWNTRVCNCGHKKGRKKIEFNILSVDGKRNYGKVIKLLSKGTHFAMSGDDLNIKITSNMDIYDKTLLMGAAIVMDRKLFYKDPDIEAKYPHVYPYY